MSCENDVVKTIAFICISNPMSCTELIDNVYVLKEMIDVRDGFKECVGFSMEEVEAIIEDICLN